MILFRSGRETSIGYKRFYSGLGFLDEPYSAKPAQRSSHTGPPGYTDKKIFLIKKKIQKGTVAKSYVRKGFLIYEEMQKYLVIFEETAPV
jgi:hypothetical protein